MKIDSKILGFGYKKGDKKAGLRESEKESGQTFCCLY